MKVEQDNIEFKPVTIVLETKLEFNQLFEVINDALGFADSDDKERPFLAMLHGELETIKLNTPLTNKGE